MLGNMWGRCVLLIRLWQRAYATHHGSPDTAVDTLKQMVPGTCILRREPFTVRRN